MTEASQTQTETPTTPTTPPLANSPDARTPEGEIRDVQSTATTDQTQTDSAKPAEAKPTEGDKKPDAAQGAPEKYEFTAPEGFKINQEVIDKATPIFKELGLSQEAAQKLVNLQMEREAKAATAGAEAYNAIREGWRKEVLANPDLSTGGKLKPEVSESIARAIDGIGDASLSKGFREVMDMTGVGDNPHFVNMIFKLSKSFNEGKHVAGKGPSELGQKSPDAKPATIANALYPNLR